MPITDKQMAVMRAQLTRDVEQRERLWEELEQDGGKAGYMVLLEAACFLAIDRRFGEDRSAKDVVEFVGDVRTRAPEFAERLDPVAAERLIRAVLDGTSLEDMDDKTRFSTEGLLLAALIVDEEFDEAGLEAFLRKVRATGESMD